MPADTCERLPDGSSVGCRRSEEVCVRTNAGVRRCMIGGCALDEPWRCQCLPDPDDPSSGVCWEGGTRFGGEPCESHYECADGACGPDGLCTSWCLPGSDRYRCASEWVCRDNFCVPR